MYKVFINKNKLILTDKAPRSGARKNKYIAYKNSRQIKELVRHLEAQNVNRKIVLYHYDIDELWVAFVRSFKYVQAAGGLVLAGKSEPRFLLIFRNGKWDLPKGHLKKGERPEYAAIREVEEECGISDLEITGVLDQTYHMYDRKDQTYLKKTFWYTMTSDYSGPLDPQVEEGIEEAVWLFEPDLVRVKKNVFPLVWELLKKGLKKNMYIR